MYNQNLNWKQHLFSWRAIVFILCCVSLTMSIDVGRSLDNGSIGIIAIAGLMVALELSKLSVFSSLTILKENKGWHLDLSILGCIFLILASIFINTMYFDSRAYNKQQSASQFEYDEKILKQKLNSLHMQRDNILRDAQLKTELKHRVNASQEIKKQLVPVDEQIAKVENRLETLRNSQNAHQNGARNGLPFLETLPETGLERYSALVPMGSFIDVLIFILVSTGTRKEQLSEQISEQSVPASDPPNEPTKQPEISIDKEPESDQKEDIKKSPVEKTPVHLTVVNHVEKLPANSNIPIRAIMKEAGVGHPKAKLILNELEKIGIVEQREGGYFKCTNLKIVKQAT